MTQDRSMRAMSREVADLLGQAILPIFASSFDGRLVHLGSAFVVMTSASRREALLFSAAHVLRQSLHLDLARERHHPSAAALGFVPARPDPRVLRSTRLLALLRDGKGGRHFIEVGTAYSVEPLDLALCSAFIPEASTNVIFAKKLRIDTTPPRVGTQVVAAGYGDTKTTFGVSPTGDPTASFSSKLDWRHGTIVETFPDGYAPQRLGPAFRVDVPISSGMSGGPILRIDAEGHVLAVGVNTSDWSTEVRCGFRRQRHCPNALAGHGHRSGDERWTDEYFHSRHRNGSCRGH